MSHGRPRASSFDSQMSRLPRFSKSSTMSTTGTNDSGPTRLEVTSAMPSSKTHRESVEIAPGAFSKPRVHKRSRRGTQDSAKSEGARSGQAEAGAPEKEFKYYGRHANQWLFNDFSVTDAVSKGFRRVFGKDADNGDWYENRRR
ncbi:Nn.00g063800.m01.CDS01 [Neocucurbitaria sp. VM-36]